MRVNRSAVAGLATVMAVAALPSGTRSSGAVPGTGAQSRLPLQPLGVRGEAIWPAFEGWGPDKRDGTNLILIGYNNRNTDQEMDIPIGPNNHIEPGGPDHGQPTHFLAGRQWGVFAVAVPKDFGTRRLTWTLTANGHVSVVQFWLNPPYWVDFYRHPATLNEPPVVRFSPDGPELTGPPRGTAQTLSGTVTRPVRLNLWVTDEPNKTVFESEPRARARWSGPSGLPRLRSGDRRGGPRRRDGGARRSRPRSRGGHAAWHGWRGYRCKWSRRAWRPHLRPRRGRRRDTREAEADVAPGLGPTSWSSGRSTAGRVGSRSTTRGSSSAMAATRKRSCKPRRKPGSASLASTWLRAQVNDSSGDGGRGEQCCWTNAHVKVIVK